VLARRDRRLGCETLPPRLRRQPSGNLDARRELRHERRVTEADEADQAPRERRQQRFDRPYAEALLGPVALDPLDQIRRRALRLPR
jgi:hypothetical protein